MRQAILLTCLMTLSGYMVMFGAFLITMGPPLASLNDLTFEDALATATLFLGAFGLVAATVNV